MKWVKDWWVWFWQKQLVIIEDHSLWVHPYICFVLPLLICVCLLFHVLRFSFNDLHQIVTKMLLLKEKFLLLIICVKASHLTWFDLVFFQSEIRERRGCGEVLTAKTVEVDTEFRSNFLKHIQDKLIWFFFVNKLLRNALNSKVAGNWYFARL